MALKAFKLTDKEKQECEATIRRFELKGWEFIQLACTLINKRATKERINWISELSGKSIMD
jgi:hypothetical protein